MALPTEKTKAKTDLWEFPILLYGPPKIGKSTLVAEIDNVLFVNTGGGLDALDVFQVPVTTWEEFLEVGKEFTQGTHNFKVCCIDTVDRLHKMCITYMIQQHNLKNPTKAILHPQDLDFGKGYDLIKDEMMRPLMKLVLCKYGLIMTSHTVEKQVKTRVMEISKTMPTLQDHVWQLIDSITGIIMLYTMEGTKRVIKATPNESWIAGDRTGRLARHGDIIIGKEGTNWKMIEGIFKSEPQPTLQPTLT